MGLPAAGIRARKRRRKIQGLIPKNSPRPPQTPAIMPLERRSFVTAIRRFSLAFKIVGEYYAVAFEEVAAPGKPEAGIIALRQLRHRHVSR
jgi:hypothetical protein